VGELVDPITVGRFTFFDDFDAGDTLRVEGPGKTLGVPHPAIPTLYLSVLEPKSPTERPFFGAGEWTVSAPGGRTAAPFSTSRPLPPPLRWTNRAAFAAAVDRTADRTILWAVTDTPDDGMTVTVSRAAGLPASATALMCRAPASAGRPTISAALLTQLARIPFGRLELRLAPRPERRVRLSLLLTGAGSERAVFEYLYTDTLRIDLR
jgi:hypothetical protein